MDYLEIVFKDFKKNREHLENHFFREYKKAEKEYFEPDEFFTNCLQIIQDIEDKINKEIIRLKNLFLHKSR